MFEIFFLGDLRDGVSRYFQERYQEERPWAAFRYMRVEGEQGTEYEGGCIEYPGAGTTLPLIDLHSLVGEYWKEDGFAMKEAIRKVAEEAEQKLLPIDFSVMKEFQQAKGRLSMELINRERNQEKLSWRPYLPFLDLAIRFWVDLGTYEGKTVACLVTWKEMKDWGVTLEELCEVACQNEQKQGIQIRLVGDLLEEEPGIGDNVSGMEGFPLFVMTTKRKCYGAVSLLDKEALRSFVREQGWEGVSIIPSSIHEVLLLPPGICEVEQLVEIVRQVNNSMVPKDDILSYHVYQYQDKTGEITDLCSE